MRPETEDGVGSGGSDASIASDTDQTKQARQLNWRIRRVNAGTRLTPTSRRRVKDPTEAWDRGGNGESETDNAIEVIAEVPSVPRSNRVQSRSRTLPRTEKTTVSARTVGNEIRDTITPILAAIEDLRTSSGRLHAVNDVLEAGNEELRTHKVVDRGTGRSQNSTRRSQSAISIG